MERTGNGWRVGGPNGIRTRVLALRGPRPRPLDDGTIWLGREDSNPYKQIQSLPSCHWTTPQELNLYHKTGWFVNLSKPCLLPSHALLYRSILAVRAPHLRLDLVQPGLIDDEFSYEIEQVVEPLEIHLYAFRDSYPIMPEFPFSV